jgi:hypothetical protein
MEAVSQNDPPPKSLRPSAKAISSLWVQLPDTHPVKFLLVKKKLPEVFIFPPVAIAPSLNMSRPSGKTSRPLA